MNPEDERRQYTARQYESLREECAGARQSQHTILQWSQAVSGTLFAAALVAGAHSGRLVVAARFIFGLVLPAVLLGAALAWAGEMIRMERTGVYMRALERATWDERSGDGLKDTSFFIWENVLWWPPEQFSKAGFRKQNTGYAGVAIFYAIMFTGSLAAFCVLSPWLLSLITCVVWGIIGVLAIIFPAVQIFSLGGADPIICSVTLDKWRESLPREKGILAQSVALQRTVKMLQPIAKMLRRIAKIWKQVFGG
jgi:hypothetical protein